MSDPAVYNDHRQAADAGRRLKELETPKRLADEWRQARDDLDAARGRPRARGDGVGARERPRAARGRAAARTRRTRSGGREGRHRRDPAGRRRRRGCALGGRRPADAHALRGADRLQDGDAVDERERGRRREGGRLRRQGAGRVLDLQVRGWNAPRAARARDRVAGAHPHVDRDGRGHARGRGGRDRDPRERPPRRRHALDRSRRAEREHDRLGRPHHAPSHRPRGRDAGREVAAAEPREGDACPSRPAVRARAREAAGRARRVAPLADRDGSARRRSGRTTSPRAG